MTLSQLALTIAILGGLGLLASRFGLSAIPAYLLAGLLLGPNEPRALSVIEPSDVTTFVAELGIILLLFFLGLEFTFERLLRSGRHLGLGGSIDLVLNAGVGFLVGLVAFGLSFAAVILAAAVYVSSSAVTVKGLIAISAGLPTTRPTSSSPFSSSRTSSSPAYLGSPPPAAASVRRSSRSPRHSASSRSRWPPRVTSGASSTRFSTVSPASSSCSSPLRCSSG